MAFHAVLLEFALVFAASVVTASKSNFTIEDEMNLLRKLDVVGYAKLYGFRLDRMRVITIDGWLLEMHRVRNMEIFDKNWSTPVFISHCFACSSVDYMVNNRHESLSFLLADLGFDVWAVNHRANKFSNKIVVDGKTQSPTPEHYYRVTWQYMAERDVPAALDKIFNVTKQEKVFVIGHSMGATILFAFLSDYDFKYYHKKILFYGSLAPVIRFGKDTSEEFKEILDVAGIIPRLAPGKRFKSLFGTRFTNLESSAGDAYNATCNLIPEVCDLSKIMLEPNPDDGEGVELSPHINPERTELYHIVYPAGATVMNLYQFARQYRRRPWTKMDYREVLGSGITNQEEYDELEPPEYEFHRTKVPFKMWFAKKDKYFGVNTAMRIVRELGAERYLFRRTYHVLKDPNFEHNDFAWGFDARCWVYEALVLHMTGFEQDRAEKERPGRMEYRRKAFGYEQGLGFLLKCNIDRSTKKGGDDATTDDGDDDDY